MGFIYEIRNVQVDKRYVGSTSNLYKRWKDHKSRLKNGKHHSVLLQRAWDKYGEDAFEWNILLECLDEELIQKEQEYLDLGTEYNILTIADRPTGRKHSEETKNKIREKSKGNKNALGFKHTEETKIRQSKAKQGNSNAKGAVRSEEYKKNSSENRMGSIPWNKNKKGSQEAWNKQIIQIFKDDELICEMGSLTLAAEFLGVNQSAISKALNSKTNKCKKHILKRKNND